MTPADVLDGIMARELESEAVLVKIASTAPDDTTMERLDQLVISAKKSDEQVWTVLKDSMETAAAKYGWLAVKKHLAKSEVHDLLKERITTRVNAGIEASLSDEKKVEDIIAGELTDRSMEPKMRSTFREMIAEGRSDILARMSDPMHADELRAAVQLVVAQRANDTTTLNRLVQYGMCHVDRKLESQMKILEDLFAREFVGAEAHHARHAIAEIFAEAGDNLEHMLDTIGDKERLHNMRMDVRARVDRVKNQISAAEKLLASEFIGTAHEAKARSAVKEIFDKAGDGLKHMLDDLVHHVHEMRMDVKTRVHQMTMNEAAVARRAAQLKRETDDFKAAEAKALRIANELVNQENEERKAAELKKERAKREASKAGGKASSKADSKAAMAAAKEAAKLEAHKALKAARREAQRQEEEDRATRQAIALVQAREAAALAANARRAAKKAEKREKKAQKVIVAFTLGF